MSTAPSPRRAALAFIFVTVALDVLALGIIIPVLPNLILRFLQGDTEAAAWMVMMFQVLWALMQFFFSPILGSLSDRFGRRPVILISNFGLGLDYILMALAPSLAWLLVGRIVSGITAASISTAGAYIADVTPPEKRAAGFGMIGAAFGLGFVLGPAVGGLLGGIDPRLPFWAAAGLSLSNAMYGLFVLPESLPHEKRSPFSWKRANPLGSLRLLRSRPALLGLATVAFLGFLAHEVYPATFVLYAEARYGWNETTVGLTLAAVGVCAAIVQAGVVRPAVARFGERRVLLTGLLCGAIGFVVYGLAPTGELFWLGIPIVAFWGMSGPAVQGLMTRRVEPTEQGQLQGAHSSLRGVSGLIGPFLFAAAFVAGIHGFEAFPVPGAAFLLGAIVLAGGFALAYGLKTAR